tara:strand:+ start:242 stop:556 length:315 start_codon:yes stop_codon:yes gene_type:complete
MKISTEWLEKELYEDELEHYSYQYAKFIISFVLEGRLVKQSQAIEVSVSESEFNKFTKAKQNKLLLEWENTALKEFIKDLFYNEEIISKPTDFVGCEFQNIEQY